MAQALSTEPFKWSHLSGNSYSGGGVRDWALYLTSVLRSNYFKLVSLTGKPEDVRVSSQDVYVIIFDDYNVLQRNKKRSPSTPRDMAVC